MSARCEGYSKGNANWKIALCSSYMAAPWPVQKLTWVYYLYANSGGWLCLLVDMDTSQFGWNKLQSVALHLIYSILHYKLAQSKLSPQRAIVVLTQSQFA